MFEHYVVSQRTHRIMGNVTFIREQCDDVFCGETMERWPISLPLTYISASCRVRRRFHITRDENIEVRKIGQ